MAKLKEELIYRTVNMETDREALLSAHCAVNFASDPPRFTADGYTAYREKWLSTRQPDGFLDAMTESLKDPRTLAAIVENGGGERVGYMWVRFTDVPDYHYTFAEIDEIIVFEPFRRMGYAMSMMEHAKRHAKDKGADVLRSGLAAHNTASRKLHEKAGFAMYRREYEMEL